MAKWQIDAMLDAALDYIKNNGTQLTVCNAQPTTYAEANVTFKLAKASGLTTGSYTGPVNGDTSGRKLTVNTAVDMTIDTTGTATHVAIASGTVLLYVTTCTSQALTSGGTVTTPAWDMEIADAA